MSSATGWRAPAVSSIADGPIPQNGEGVQFWPVSSDTRVMTPITRPVVGLLFACTALASCGSDAVQETAPVVPIEPAAVEATDPPPERTALAEVDTDAQHAELDEGRQLFDAAVGSTYTVVFEFEGSVRADGSINVEVANGEVVDVRYPDQLLASVLPEIPLLTVADMFDRARATLNDGGSVEFTLDGSYGHPVELRIDPIPDAIDDEYTVRVLSVEPGDDTLSDGDGY